jgi:hypothetical protein
MLIVLESVATAIDDQTLITYAMYENGSIDKESGVPLSKCSESWHKSLNEDDKYMVKHLIDVKKYFK